MLENGDVLQFAPGIPQVVDSVPTGRLAVDGERIVPLKGGVLSARRRMLFNGVAVGSLAMDSAGRLIGPVKVSAPGLLDEADGKARHDVESEFLELLNDLPSPLRLQEAAFADAARAGLRRIIGKRYGKRPIVDVHVLQIQN